MHGRRRRLPFSILSLVFLLPAHMAGDEGADAARFGVVVEEVAPGSGAHKAGVQPGDVIVSWSRAPAPPANPEAAEGRIASPFDLAGVEIEQVHRGPVVLAGRRGEEVMSWTLPRLALGLTVRPPLAPELLALYQGGKDLIGAKKAAEGVARWRAAAIRAKDEGQGFVGAWLLATAARALNEAKSWTEADAAWEEAAREATAASRPDAAAQILWQRGTALYNRREKGAEEHFSRSLALGQARDPNSLAVARDLHALAEAVFDLRRDHSGAVPHYERALEIRERLAPDSIILADTLNRLGFIAYQRGDLRAQEAYTRRALAIQERLDPDGLGVARSLTTLAILMRDRGDPTAEDYDQRALGIRERLAPDSLSVAASLNNLGVHARARGDLAAAEDYHQRALAIKERLAPGSAEVLMSLANLAAIHYHRGDHAAAEQGYRSAHRILERLAPDSLDVALVLRNLGEVALDRGDLVAAEENYRRALTINEKLAPGSSTVVSALDSIGKVAIKRGDLDSAEETLRRALSIAQSSALESEYTADAWRNLGHVARQRGNLPTAEEHYHRALAIVGRIAPQSAQEAETLHDLAVIHLRSDRKEQAAALLLRALDTLEALKARLGGTEEARVGFAAKFATYYHEAVEVLIGLERPAEALHVLERSRARSLLALLAERDVLFSADLPAELARERRMADADYDRVQKKLADLDPARDDAEIQKLVGRLKELRQTQEDIASRIRKASPRFAALQYPEPLDLQRVRATLDPDTVFLAYSVGAETTVLFVVQPADVPGPGLRTVLLPIGEKALREKVEAFRWGIQRPEAGGKAALADQGAELYELLIRPAESEAAASRRLLLGPDGPLHSLPFAALVRRDPPRARPGYLVEWKPLHVVASATVYAELKRARREAPSTAGRLVAFGDPRYPAPAKQDKGATDPGLREVTRSFTLTPLPFTRQEVARIARLFPGRARAYLGDEATEAHAKALDRDARYVHFACHGTLDERFPLNSALALSIPEAPAAGGDNGLLQAWEIFDKVRIDAELVTLSACDTALGKEMGGEGLLGLTRAFHYAGARSVLATLWGVSDTSTPRLMERFYSHLRAGKSRDEALRAAQLDFIRGGADVAHPFRWAALQLSGDWR
jgi:CHAT domain-containing protein/tetratricopeptide (TPR) repeat protein